MPTTNQLNWRQEFNEAQVRLDRLEVGLRNATGREINRYIRAYAKAYEQNDMTLLPFLKHSHADNIRRLMQTMVTRTVPQFGKLSLQHIRTATKEIEPDYWSRLVDRWLLTYGLARAEGIANTTTVNIAAAIATSRRETVSTDQAARAIRRVAGLTPSRAALIARTETHNAAMFASDETAKEAEKDLEIRLLKFWVPVTDERTRVSHAVMSGSEGIPLDQRFRVGGEMLMRPGDPRGSAANTINCRCVMVHREQEFEIDS